MTMFKPFYYQEQAWKNFYYFIKDSNNKGKNPLIVAPTGAGKSHIIALICSKVKELYPNVKVLILSHTVDIIQQNAEKLRAYIPHLKIGINSASLSQREVEDITVASIQSVYNSGSLFKDYQLVIIDEAHKIPDKETSQYRKLLSEINPTFVLGLTATPFRLGKGSIVGPNEIFHKIIFEISIKRLIQEGFLCSFSTKQAKIQMDLSHVKVVAGDYSVKSLEQNCTSTDITEQICKDLIRYKDTRKHWLIFAISINHAEKIADILERFGVKTAFAHSKLPSSLNKRIIEKFKQGEYQALVNVEKYTTGFDYPGIDMVVLMRPTKSPVLHVQMIGRGSRVIYNKNAVDNFDIHNKKHRLKAIAESEKPDCLVLDFAGNLKRLGPIDKLELDQIQKDKKGKGRQLTKVCPECDEVVPLQVKICPDCGFEWKPLPKLLKTASEAPVISKEESKRKLLTVKNVYYTSYMSKKGNDLLKVTYSCEDLKTITQFLTFDPKSSIYSISSFWWKQRSDSAVPSSVEEALSRICELKQPKQLEVDFSGRYPKITYFTF